MEKEKVELEKTRKEEDLIMQVYSKLNAKESFKSSCRTLNSSYILGNDSDISSQNSIKNLFLLLLHNTTQYNDKNKNGKKYQIKSIVTLPFLEAIFLVSLQ